MASRITRQFGEPAFGFSASNDPGSAHTEEEVTKDTEHDVSAVLGVLLICLLTALLIRNARFKYLHESGASIGIGVSVGILAHASGGHIQELANFSPSFFFVALLPPIIFESGFSMKQKNFFRNFGSIVMYAFAGTLVSVVVVGLGTWGAGAMGWVYPMSAFSCFMLACLISSTDPVTTLAIFKTMGVDNTTAHALVLGESLLNDAVALVMYRVLAQIICIFLPEPTIESICPRGGPAHGATGHTTGEDPETQGSLFEYSMPIDASFVSRLLAQFIFIFVCAILVGLFFGLLSALVAKWSPLRQHPALELPVIVIFAYAPYLVSEMFELSGIVSILFCGIVMSHYTWYSLSAKSRLSSHEFFNAIALMAETLVFLFLGIALPALYFDKDNTFEWSFIALCLALTMIGRGIMVLVLTKILNMNKTTTKISPRSQFVIWWSGLRGAVSYGLALDSNELLGFFGKKASDDGHVILTTTLSIVFVTVLIFGSSTSAIVKLAGLQREAEEKRNAARVQRETSPAADRKPDIHGRVTGSGSLVTASGRVVNRNSSRTDALGPFSDQGTRSAAAASSGSDNAVKKLQFGGTSDLQKPLMATEAGGDEHEHGASSSDDSDEGEQSERAASSASPLQILLKRSKVHKWFRGFDDNVMKFYFGGKNATITPASPSQPANAELVRRPSLFISENEVYCPPGKTAAEVEVDEMLGGVAEGVEENEADDGERKGSI